MTEMTPQGAFAEGDRLFPAMPREHPPSITLLQIRAFNTAQAHGFDSASFGERIALIHSELSEALEDYRNGRDPADTFYSYDTTGYSGSLSDLESLREDLDAAGVPAKPCGIPSELADAVIRILDMAEAYGINLEQAILEKMAYNDTRSHRHGGKIL